MNMFQNLQEHMIIKSENTENLSREMKTIIKQHTSKKKYNI